MNSTLHDHKSSLIADSMSLLGCSLSKVHTKALTVEQKILTKTRKEFFLLQLSVQYETDPWINHSKFFYSVRENAVKIKIFTAYIVTLGAVNVAFLKFCKQTNNECADTCDVSGKEISCKPLIICFFIGLQ